MRINLHVSLIALLVTMVSLSQPSWSMEESADQDMSEVKSSGEKRKRENGDKPEKGKDTPTKRTRKFNRKRPTLPVELPPTTSPMELHPIGFNDLPWELQAKIWAYALAEKDSFAYYNLSLVNKFGRAYTQAPNVLGEALNLCIFEPRIVWDQEQDEQDKENNSQANQESQVQVKQEQDKENPIVSKFLALKKAPYKKPPFYDDVPISPLLTAMRYNPSSHALVYHLATYLLNKDIEKIVPFDDLKSIIIQMQKTKSFLVSGLLEDRAKGRPLDTLKYEAFLKLFYALRNQQDYIDENNIPKTEFMEEECPLEKETDSIRKAIKKHIITMTTLINLNISTMTTLINLNLIILLN